MKSVKSCGEPIKPEYPKLMVASDGVVVLFTAWETGTVLHEGDEDALGTHSDHWDMSCFDDYSGSVTLSNGG